MNFFREIGTPDEVRAATTADPGTAEVGKLSDPRFNAHIHLPPNFSAFETVQQAVELAAAERLNVIGVSNYYDYEVYEDFGQQASSRGIFPLFGLEIICLDERLRDDGVKVNDPGNPGKIYICGKGITRFGKTGAAQMTSEAARLLRKIRENDSTRMATMVERLEQVCRDRGFATGIGEADVIDMVVRRHQSPRETVYLQERHICQAFQERLFDLFPAEERLATLNEAMGAPTKAAGPDDFVAIQNDIRSHLIKAGKPAFVEEAFVSFSEAIRLILELGGIPCYPTLADGTSPICPFEDPLDALVAELKRRNIHAAELIPIRNSIDVASRYIRAYREAGMIVTAGTEHNTLDCIPLEPSCVDGPIPDDIQEILWEGICVVAAHQFLTAHGECGYVDSQGNPNPVYADSESRIQDFARLGAVVISRCAGTAS